jgi:TrpR-related protein YerC/YecD
MVKIPSTRQEPTEHPLRTPIVEDFLTVLNSARSNDEMFSFMLDVATPRELTEMAHRWHVARLLVAGKGYAEIERETGVSAATIARVSKCVQHGSRGYLTLLERLEEDS